MKRITLLVCCVAIAMSFGLLEGCTKDNKSQAPTADSAKTSQAVASPDTSKLAAATAGATAITGKALDGQKIFYNASFGKFKIACAGCHADGQPTTKDSRLRAGHTLAGVTSRTATWNGEFKGASLAKNAYGAALCASLYQARTQDGDYTKALQPAEVDALNAYFAAIATSEGAITKNIAIQWGTKPAFKQGAGIDQAAAKVVAKAILRLPGDPGSGEAVWTRSCAYCHNMTDKKIGPPMKDAMTAMDYGAVVLRCGSDGMVFFGRDIMTDQQCADVLACIQKQLGK